MGNPSLRLSEVLTVLPLVQVCPGKSVVRWTDRPAMTIAVDLGRKATKQNIMYRSRSHRYLVDVYYMNKQLLPNSIKT